MTNHTSTIDSFQDFLNHFKKYGKREALSTADQKIQFTYQDLYNQVNAFASILSNKIKPGERIILVDLPGPSWVVAFLSVILNKAIAVPLDNRMSQELKDEIIQMVGAEWIITNDEYSTYDLPRIPHTNIPSNSNWQPSVIDLNTPAEIIFTSGTWGKPKGVVLTHNNILSNVNSVRQVYSPKMGEKFLSILPLAHAYEQMIGLLVPLACGCQIIYQDSLDSYSLLASLKKHKADYIAAVPKFLEILQRNILKKVEKKKFIFDALRTLAIYLPLKYKRLIFQRLHKEFGGNLKTFIIGGAPLSHTVESFFRALGFSIFIGYGLSESSPVLTISLENTRPKNSAGKPIPNVQLEIAEDNEIIAFGPNISPGYWPILSTSPEQRLLTGDLGYLDQYGRLILTGRKKNMVVFPTGDKIQMEDIETIADSLPGIQESCAIVTIQSDQPEMGLVYVGDVIETVALNQINNKLPLFARLQWIQKWESDTLPRTHTLKLQRAMITATTLDS